ncbi:hypothetical protein DFR29_13211 [Tahibacter aquaticus]|uniref:Uncharacterized protein n=1 Tax=Tahibacter aquaticus TaxID=520092 RepID=A0A4R6YHK9_9GAMM|nr:hypothetical protein DFR29_13211 [Tahibacter aquaticus]
MRTSLSTELLKVADERELSCELRRMDFVMPDRNKRTKDQVEVHGIVQLLATLSDDYWHFPIRLVHRDRPDFLIETHTRRIGVEHVEVVSPLEAKMDGLRAEGHGAEVHFIRRAAIGADSKQVQTHRTTGAGGKGRRCGDRWVVWRCRGRRLGSGDGRRFGRQSHQSPQPRLRTVRRNVVGHVRQLAGSRTESAQSCGPVPAGPRCRS